MRAKTVLLAVPLGLAVLLASLAFLVRRDEVVRPGTAVRYDDFFFSVLDAKRPETVGESERRATRAVPGSSSV